MNLSATPITVVLVEDDARIRRVLSAILDNSQNSRCVGQYDSGEEAVSAIPELSPHVIIMDINLPGINGVECVRQLVAKGVTAQILMLTVHNDTGALFDALEAGATGYLVKPVPAEQLLAAVQDIYGGGAPMTSSIARRVVQRFRRTSPIAGESLSERETQVLQWLVKGHSYKEIAAELKINYTTINTYIRRIYKKLHVNSRAEAVARITEQK